MKKCMTTIIFTCIAVFLFSSSVFASLEEGTWNSSTGTYKTRLGTWIVVTGGTFPEHIGSTAAMTSSGSGAISWNYLNGTQIGNSYDSGFIPDGSGGYYRDFIGEFRGGVLTCLFIDGNTYTSNQSVSQVFYRMIFGSSYNLLGLTNWSWNGEGLVNGHSDYKLITYGTGFLTGSNSTSIWGDLDYTQATLVKNSVVPIPGAVWLLVSGLFGLIGLKKRISI